MKRNHPDIIKRTGIFLLCCALCLCSCASQELISGPDRSVLPASLQELSFEEHLDISVGYWDIDAMVKSTRPGS